MRNIKYLQTTTMSLKWDWSLALPSGQPLSDTDCLHLLDEDSSDACLDIFNNLTSATKIEPFDNGLPSGLAYSPTHSLYPMSPLEDCKPSRSELANKLLNELDQCKEESFSDWLEEKVDLPIFEQYPVLQEPIRACPVEVPPAPLVVPAPLSHDYGLHYITESAPQQYYEEEQPRTQDLLREFDKVYVAVEATHLTPPQSPPGPATQLLLNLQAPYAVQQQQQHYAEPPPAPVVDSWRRPEIEAVVDEIVRHSAGAMQPCGPPSPASPPRSPPASPSTSASSASRASSGDEEWAPRASARSKPYARSVDDKRSRKKEQNKNAATRYRQKKKAEVEVLLGEEHALRQRQDELQTKCSDVQREIRYLKGLMRDLFKAKGLIK